LYPKNKGGWLENLTDLYIDPPPWTTATIIQIKPEKTQLRKLSFDKRYKNRK
jgi:hypothetical protein